LYLDADWNVLARMWGEEPPEFLADLVPRKAHAPAERAIAWGELPVEDARAQISNALRKEVTAVLALDRPFASTTPFFDLGMDSLTALELRNRLQAEFALPIPATLLFDYPSLEPLCAWMLKQVGVDPEASADLSERDLERLLAAKIDELEARGLR
jgi:acyl carrier protein